MSYRIAQRPDFATGLFTQQALVDYWGQVVIDAHARIMSQSQEEQLAHRALWIWEGEEPPQTPPRDTERPPSYRLWQELEIDSLRQFTRSERALPANFLAIVWRHSAIIAYINENAPCHPLALLSLGNHPSNALRNAYACGILADRIGKNLNLPIDERRAICSAALTMNWTIFELQDKLSSARGNPSAQDLSRIKAHSLEASNFLRAHGLTNKTWLLSVEQHHEEPDARGYPARLKETETHLGARILRACDRFVAMTSSRRFRMAISTQEASEALTRIIPSTDGLLQATMKDLGERPPGGVWTHRILGGRHLSLGGGMGLPLETTFPLSIVEMGAEFVECGQANMSGREISLALDRLDQASKI